MARSEEAGWSNAVMALALLALGILLCFLGVGLLGQWQTSADRNQEAPVGVLLGAAAAAAGLGLLLWWAFSILAAGASVLLEHLGRRRAAAAARRLSPAFMRRAVVAALSLQLVAGAAANAAPATPGPEWTPTQAYAASVPSDPAALGTAEGRGRTLGAGGTQVPTPTVVADDAPGALEDPATARSSRSEPPDATLDPGWQPAPPMVEPGLLVGPQTRSTSGPDSGGEGTAVTVIAGDTLWDIVATYLGPEASDVDVALEWPRWYATNRALIGGSPDVLLPGQILQAPAAP
ncbi:LysM peptidoglycan-binding domain-containing protein [Arthrobacter sp. FW306-07-I]|uniref:LysM peptidoglycan-binding domain-containing protein n=1 Tax=Arthrobacter sp. FW306-07-I TaxID=2879622 RepID=UPI001F3449FB|nr:LysM domain-containing protein [Arthrobacter sp. FW306-07-I]UKA74141.1 LysM peptidoglycan-binding domain-containing protein [Arthrobacter sp. FW306-07-I]